MLDQINHILNNWDYDQALQFYKEHGGNPHLADILSSGETKFFKKKLTSELEALRDSQLESHSELVSESIPIQGEIFTPSHSKLVSESLESIRLARNRALSLQDQERREHVLAVEEALAAGKTQVNSKLPKRIMELSQELHEHWYKLDYHQKNGILPPEAPDQVQEVFENVTSEAQLVRIRDNQRSNISKGKKAGRSQQKMDFYNAILAEAEKRLALCQ